MILINLLPHREEKRKRRKQAFYAGLALSALVGAGCVLLWYGVLSTMISAQQDRNLILSEKIKVLEQEIKDIANLKAEIEGLKARQKVVEDFQIDRNMPVHLLNELVAQTPEGVYLSALKQDGQNVTVSGVAQTNERVSEFLRNTAYNSPWLQKPELVEIKAASPNANNPDQKRLFDFAVRLALQRPQDKAAKAAEGAASGAVPGAAVPAAPASAPAPRS
jgi:type IV pilus assembly protein PilN